MMSTIQNERILLVSRPKGVPTAENFTIDQQPLEEAKEGQLQIQTIYISVDPYMRGRMSEAKSYAASYALNEPVAGGSIGKVLQSNDSRYQEGDIVVGGWGWQRYAVVEADTCRKVDPELAPISTAVGVLGMPGLTAYFGTLRIGNPQPGETLVVSGAGGAVGMLVGQIGKIKGCRVVGISGSEEKNRYLLDELGFDAVINYKDEKPVREALEEACPDGVDIYFDNVGGEISDAVIDLLNTNARIPLCGQISLYNNEKPDIGPRIQPTLLKRTVLLKGFLVGDYAADAAEGLKEMGSWVKEGKIKYRENIVEGFENTPKAFIGLFSGENLGKQLVKVTD